MQKNNGGNPSENQILNFGHKAIVFPALIPPPSSSSQGVHREGMLPPAGEKERVEDKQISFLFSVRQVEDIIKETSVYPVPFSPPYIEGITQWREHVVPVISLEKCLGFEIQNKNYEIQNTRLIMVRIPSLEEDSPRSAFTDPKSQISNRGGEKRIMFRVAPSIRMVSLPIPCTPLSSVRRMEVKIRNLELVRGIYEWEEGYLVVAHTISILFGATE